MACLDSGRVAEAESLIWAIAARFPKSLRAKKLTGMAHEARGDLLGAETIYEAILKARWRYFLCCLDFLLP